MTGYPKCLIVFFSGRFFRDGSVNLDYRSFKVAPQLLNSIFLSQVGFKGGYSDVDKIMLVPLNFEDDQLLVNFLMAFRLFVRFLVVVYLFK